MVWNAVGILALNARGFELTNRRMITIVQVTGEAAPGVLYTVLVPLFKKGDAGNGDGPMSFTRLIHEIRCLL